MTGLVVLKMVLMPSRQRRASLANSGPRWSMIGVSMARRMRSGSGVGPGICRKCRPGVRDEFFDMIFLRFSYPILVSARRPEGAAERGIGPQARRLAAMNDECECQSSPFKPGAGPAQVLVKACSERDPG